MLYSVWYLWDKMFCFSSGDREKKKKKCVGDMNTPKSGDSIEPNEQKKKVVALFVS